MVTAAAARAAAPGTHVKELIDAARPRGAPATDEDDAEAEERRRATRRMGHVIQQAFTGRGGGLVEIGGGKAVRGGLPDTLLVQLTGGLPDGARDREAYFGNAVANLRRMLDGIAQRQAKGGVA